MLKLRDYEAGDLEAVRQLIGDDVFDETRWTWEVERNPAGQSVVVALEGERVIAVVCARPIRMRFRGEERTFTLGLEAHVDTARPAGLANPGPVVRASRQLIEQAAESEGEVAFYGWPKRTAWRVSKQLLKAQSVRSQSALVRGVDGNASDAVETIERYDEQASWLYDRCCGVWGISAKRDDSFYNWRFVDDPTRDYRCLGVRDDEGILRGTAVVRLTDWLGERRAVVVDWMVPEDEPDMADRLLRGVDAVALEAGARTVAVCVPEWSSWFARFQTQGFSVVDTGEILVARSCVKFMDDLWLRAQWWLTLADSDLV